MVEVVAALTLGKVTGALKAAATVDGGTGVLAPLFRSTVGVTEKSTMTEPGLMPSMIIWLAVQFVKLAMSWRKLFSKVRRADGAEIELITTFTVICVLMVPTGWYEQLPRIWTVAFMLKFVAKESMQPGTPPHTGKLPGGENNPCLCSTIAQPKHPDDIPAGIGDVLDWAQIVSSAGVQEQWPCPAAVLTHTDGVAMHVFRLELLSPVMNIQPEHPVESCNMLLCEA
jgi:hypothetical protein